MIGVVAIGRNEGDRLRTCLESVGARASSCVYVDSGSHDDSVAWARAQGAQVIELSRDIPFTAARARNAGLHALLRAMPQLRYIQFVDGDCEVVDGWLEAARRHLDENPRCAGVCGRRRERHPEQSIYNALCDLEWDTPVGETRATGGDAMFRVEALRAVGGYRESLIAGEEPEMCLRLRGLGWTIHRLAQDMTLHDAAMRRFGQWWRRTERAGHAYAEGHFLHGGGQERYYSREVTRALTWGAVLPLATVALLLAGSHGWIVGPAAYLLQVVRLIQRDAKGPQARLLRWRAVYLVLGRIPEALGALRFYARHLQRRPSRLIEYK